MYVEAVKVSSKTGISRHIIGLVEALTNNNDGSHHYYLYYQVDLLKGKRLEWLQNKPNVSLRPLPFPKGWLTEHPSLWWKFYLPFHLWKDRIDVFHGPNHLIPLTGKTAKVVTIHDIAYYYMEVHGKGLDRALKNATDESMRAADAVVTVSKSTATDCIKEGVLKEKVDVIYQGFEPAPDVHNQRSKTRETPYILYVGTIQPRKNVEYIVRAFAEVKDTIPHNLILAGAPGDSSAAVEQLIIDLKLSERVTLTGYISDRKRHDLYSNADIFVYPSKYEGFGLVLLEAMSYGVPVITASNSSLVEAAGEAAIYCDGHTPSTLARSISRLVTDDELKRSLIENGYQQIKKFTWEKCANQTLAVYKRVARLK